MGDFGFDSLMALELRNVLEAGLGVPVARPPSIWRYPALERSPITWRRKLGLALDAPKCPSPPPRDELERMATAIAGLSEAEMEALLLEQIERMSKTP